MIKHDCTSDQISAYKDEAPAAESVEVQIHASDICMHVVEAGIMWKTCWIVDGKLDKHMNK